MHGLLWCTLQRWWRIMQSDTAVHALDLLVMKLRTPLFVNLVWCGITLSVPVYDQAPSLESGFVTPVIVCLMPSESMHVTQLQLLSCFTCIVMLWLINLLKLILYKLSSVYINSSFHTFCCKAHLVGKFLGWSGNIITLLDTRADTRNTSETPGIWVHQKQTLGTPGTLKVLKTTVTLQTRNYRHQKHRARDANIQNYMWLLQTPETLGKPGTLQIQNTFCMGTPGSLQTPGTLSGYTMQGHYEHYTDIRIARNTTDTRSTGNTKNTENTTDTKDTVNTREHYRHHAETPGTPGILYRHQEHCEHQDTVNTIQTPKTLWAPENTTDTMQKHREHQGYYTDTRNTVNTRDTVNTIQTPKTLWTSDNTTDTLQKHREHQRYYTDTRDTENTTDTRNTRNTRDTTLQTPETLETPGTLRTLHTPETPGTLGTLRTLQTPETPGTPGTLQTPSLVPRLSAHTQTTRNFEAESLGDLDTWAAPG